MRNYGALFLALILGTSMGCGAELDGADVAPKPDDVSATAEIVTPDRPTEDYLGQAILTVDELSDTLFLATIVQPALGDLQIDAEIVEPGHVLVELVINGQIFDAEVDHVTRLLVVDGHDQYVSETDHELIVVTLEAIYAVYPADEAPRPLHMQHANDLLRFLGDALPVYDMNRLEGQLRNPAGELGDEGLSSEMLDEENVHKYLWDDGFSCIAYNHMYNGQYDYASGFLLLGSTLVNFTGYVVGSYKEDIPVFECHGRCGPGCDSAAGNGGAWTLDCLEHDQCVWDRYGQNPSFGQNTIFNAHCKTELANAFYDYFLPYTFCPGTTTTGNAVAAHIGPIVWGYFNCSGTNCSSPRHPIGHNVDWSTSWNPCSGAPFSWSAFLHFEPGFDYLRVNGVNYSGYWSSVSGYSSGAASIAVHTDHSVTSYGVYSTSATCNYFACSGRDCYTYGSQLGNNVHESETWTPCGSNTFTYSATIDFENNYDYLQVGSTRYDGRGVTISGTATGSVAVTVHTDGSVSSGGISGSLHAVCPITPVPIRRLAF